MSIEELKPKKRTHGLLSLIMALTIFMTACGDNSTPAVPAQTSISAPISPTASATSAITTALATANQATTALPTPTTVTTTTASPTPSAVVSTSPAATAASEAGADGLYPDETEVSFTSGKDQIYGSLLVPNDNKVGKKPAALILVGSSPVDRNANLPNIPNTYRNFAQVLADQGVVSLRYDKLGTGKTGQASYSTHLLDIDFNVYLDEALAAYNYLKSRPEVDPNRMMILGHSEGGLIALVVADQLKSSGGPKALVLAAPVSRPILELFRLSLVADMTDRIKNGTITQVQADGVLAEFDSISKNLLETGKLPAFKDPNFNQVFPPETEKFIAQSAKYDPVKIAAGLPNSLSVLLMCGNKDTQISCSDVKILAQGFENAGNKNVFFYQIGNLVHSFKEVPGTPRGYPDFVDPNIKYSVDANDKLATFVKTKL